MRMKLKKGKQTELILKAKQNKSWKQLAKELKVNEAYLGNELKKGTRLLSEELYNKLIKIANKDYSQYVLEKLNDNWGRAKGGKNSLKNPKLLVEKPSKEFAELIGVILGDGSIWSKNNYYYLRICGDSEKDREYLLNYVKPLFETIFNKKMFVYKHKNHKEIFLSIGSKDVVFTLNYWGLLAGNKKHNNQGIPKWIFESEDYLKACVRGLIDTDGSLCPITGRDYDYIWFSSNIKNLRKTFSLAMNQLGFRNSKWNIRKNRTPDTYIGNKKDIEKYIQTISFKNDRHLRKLNAPVV